MGDDGKRIEAVARAMFEALGTARQVAGGEEPYASLSTPAAYRVTRRVADLRLERGEQIVGRKIGFTNEEVWGRRGFGPMWGYVYDRTSLPLSGLADGLSLAGFAEPRIEPEVVFGFRDAPDAAMDEGALLDAIAWVAPGFEIVQSRFPGWQFTEAQAIAAYGLHGTLLIGEKHALSRIDARDWAASLASLSVDLICDGKVVDRGHARNVLGGPLQALRRLIAILSKDELNPPLAAGEVVTTGTLTVVPPIHAGERWSTAFSGTRLADISVTFR